MSKKIVIGVVVFVVVAAAVWLLTRNDEEPFRPVELSEIDDPAQLDELHLELAELDPTSWVRLYRPSRASSVFNLVLYRRRVPKGATYTFLHLSSSPVLGRFVSQHVLVPTTVEVCTWHPYSPISVTTGEGRRPKHHNPRTLHL